MSTPGLSRRAGHVAAGHSSPAVPRQSGRSSAIEDRRGIHGRLVHRLDLDAASRSGMFRLMADHFDGVTRETFEADLAGKDYVILLEAGGTLQGFSTLHVYESAAAPLPLTVIYSGDTIVRREAWGSPALPRTWAHAVNELTAGCRTGNLYWLLLTSGYRTYRFLPVFYREFYPRHGRPTPPPLQGLLDALARERFGAAYEPADGVVRFPRPQVLKPELLDIPEGRLRDGDIAFFVAANPGFVRGDELVCLTRLHADNLTAAARRVMEIR